MVVASYFSEMRSFLIGLLLVLCLGCDLAVRDAGEPSPAAPTEPRPMVSFTFDDGSTRPILDYAAEEWNDLILQSLDDAGLKAIFFVTGKDKADPRGRALLDEWANRGHRIGNHTYSHPFLNDTAVTVEDFTRELLRTDSLIAASPGYIPLFRFPYLKEGGDSTRVRVFRRVLEEHGYRNGYVTIDASDWYVNDRLIAALRADPGDTAKLNRYRDYYLDHIMDRARFYDRLALDLTGRHVPHTLLLHHNLTSALFLDDLIDRFHAENWVLTDAVTAFADSIYLDPPPARAAGESLIYSLAKADGNYRDLLRYPAEDSRYEIPRMRDLGLVE